MPKIKPRSSRRAPPLKDSDYDHEITLVDHGSTLEPRRTRSGESEAGPSVRPSTTEPLIPGESPSRTSPEQRRPNGTRDPPIDGPVSPRSPRPAVEVQEPTPLEVPNTQAAPPRQSVSRQEPESAIDILYENERGGFLCGIALFSSKALGNLDPTPWTNAAHHPSPTDIHTAQVPDPSWEWAWPEWRVNHDDGVDDGGWEYSFMFARKFSWHGPRWWNSFVRRRAWIRKRVKKGPGTPKNDPHLLTPEYFTVQPAAEVRRSSSRGSSRLGSGASVSQASNADTEAEEAKPDIEDVDALLRALRSARIDREKIEAVDNFLEHGQHDMARLQDEMHTIMSIFVFQASRRALLTRLTRVYDETLSRSKQDNGPELQDQVRHLEAAIKHADEEVKRLEYWSDIKAVAEVEGGDVKTAADEGNG